MVIFLRSNEIEYDPRLQKYIGFLNKKQINYLVIGWDRESSGKLVKNIIFYRKKTGYNLGRKAILSRIYFMWFLFLNLIKMKDKYSIIHACDFDTVIPALIIKYIYKKRVIFDIFDWYSDTIYTGNLIINKIISILEFISYKLSDYIIICEEERKKQIKYYHRNIYILPNIPDIYLNEYKFKKKTNNSQIVISYVGGFYKDRNIEILLSVVSKINNINLKIAGYGDKELEAACLEYSKKYSNIEYYGKVKYNIALEIMSQSDLIYAMYCKKNKNHIYAAPNKFYESLLLGVPIITTEGTIVGEKVKKYNTGFVIGEEYTDTEILLKSIQNINLEEKKNNCKKIWNDKYKNYTYKFLNDKYLSLLQKSDHS